MKNFNMGLYWKMSFLGGGGCSWKTNVQGYCLKRRLEHCADLRRGLPKKRGWCFLGEVDTPMYTMIYFKYTLKYTQNILHFSKAILYIVLIASTFKTWYTMKKEHTSFISFWLIFHLVCYCLLRTEQVEIFT